MDNEIPQVRATFNMSDGVLEYRKVELGRI